jgi:ribonuclease BN (tRNA processing enzyme)
MGQPGQLSHSRQNGVPDIWNLFLQIVQQAAHTLSPQVFLGSAHVTGNNGILLHGGERLNIRFPAVGQRPDHGIAAVFALEPRRHTPRFPFKEKIEQEGLQYIVSMVAQSDFVAFLLDSYIVKDAPPQTGAERTCRIPFRNNSFYNRISVLSNNPVGDLLVRAVFLNGAFGETGLLLVQIDGQKIEPYRSTPLEITKERQQSETVLAAAETDHDTVTVFDHVEIGDRLPHTTQEFLFQFLLCIHALLRLKWGIVAHRPPSQRFWHGVWVRVPGIQSNQKGNKHYLCLIITPLIKFSIFNFQCYNFFMQPIRVLFLGTGDAFSAGGRNQAAILIQHPQVSLLLDCGATALTSLKKHDVSLDPIDGILLSHLHGDHFSGLPFVFLHYLYVEPRTKPLKILGPEGLEERIMQLYRTMYPNDASIPPPYEMDFTEIQILQNYSIDVLQIEPFPARHQQHPPSFGFTINLDGRRIVYTGDTGWSDELPVRAEGADLFICECSYYDTQLDTHLNYKTIAKQLSNCGYKKMVLTHLGDEVLERIQELELEVVYDGSVILL